MTLNEKQLNEQPSAIAALTNAVGPSLAYHISECAHGGYIVIVDGAVHCACTHLYEAIAAMGNVAADRYGGSAIPPERATYVPADGEPVPVEDDPELDGPPRVMRPHVRRMPEGGIERAMARVRSTAQALTLALLIGSAVMGRSVA